MCNAQQVQPKAVEKICAMRNEVIGNSRGACTDFRRGFTPLQAHLVPSVKGFIAEKLVRWGSDSICWRVVNLKPFPSPCDSTRLPGTTADTGGTILQIPAPQS